MSRAGAIRGSVVFLCIATSACEPPPVAGGARQMQPGGYEEVATTDADRGSVPTWSLEFDLRIGVADTGVYDLAGTWDIAVDPAGRIYVLLTRQAEIRLFDSTGRFIRRVGARGNGPGELASPTRIALDPDQRLWVTDHARKRYVVFDSSAKFVAEHRLPARLACRPFPCGAFLADGRHVDGELQLVAPSVFRTGLFLVDTSGKRTGPIRLPLADSIESSEPVARRPFERRTVFAIDPAGTVWTGLSDAYVLTALAMNGDTTLRIKASARPLEVSAEDRESYLRHARLLAIPSPERAEFPATKPLISQLLAAPDGALWVARVDETDGEVRSFDVFRRDGTLIATVKSAAPLSIAPASAPPMDPLPLTLTNGYLYATQVDDDGRQQLVRAVIRR